MVLELWFCIRRCYDDYCHTTRLNINNPSLGHCKAANSHSTSTYARFSGLPKSQNQSVSVPLKLRTGKPSGCRGCSTSLATQLNRLWVEPYLKEATLGIAILQRLHRLIQNQVAGQENNNGDDEKTSDYSMVPSATPLEEELSKLRGAYWEHRNRLSRYDITRIKKKKELLRMGRSSCEQLPAPVSHYSRAILRRHSSMHSPNNHNALTIP